MAERCVHTYQTRLVLAPEQARALDAYAELHGRVQRSLYAGLRAQRTVNELKREFLARFGLTARQFNAARIELDGKVEAIRQRRPQLIEAAKVRVAKARRLVGKLAQSCPGTNKLHQKRRRLAVLEQRLAALQRDETEGRVGLCFGSRRLFHAQYNLQANGLSGHEEWRQQWRCSRSRQFFVLGSQDETAGNQTCQASVCEGGSLQLKLRLPDALAQDGGTKFLTIPCVRFAHGHAALVLALGMSRLVPASTRAGKPASKRVGRAISYRFLRDEKGWRVFASVEVDPAAVTTSRALGCIGVDVNADHLAVAELDRFGNLVSARRIELPTRGKSSDQAMALVGDAAVQVAALAKSGAKPLALEKLDFQKKKAELEAVDPARARVLSSFVFSKMIAALKAACLRAGVEVFEVNPAFTSVIGAVNHAQRPGISIHQGAACAVARRGLGLREAPAVREAIVPVRNGGHVTFAVPARNRAKHVWSQWSRIRAGLKASHAAHWRSPSPGATPHLCPRQRGHWVLSAFPRRDPVARTAPSTVRGASWTMFRSSGIFVHGFRNGFRRVHDMPIKKICRHGVPERLHNPVQPHPVVPCTRMEHERWSGLLGRCQVQQPALTDVVHHSCGRHCSHVHGLGRCAALHGVLHSDRR